MRARPQGGDLSRYEALPLRARATLGDRPNGRSRGMNPGGFIARLVVQTRRLARLHGLLLFLAAGDSLWTQAWVFLAIFAVGSIAFSVWLLRRDPALLASLL